MSGYNLVIKIRKLEQELDRLGLMMCPAANYYRDYGDVIAVRPKDAESLPVYSRDAEMFVGTLEALEYWIQGVEWARRYDTLVFGQRHAANRERREQTYRNEQLAAILKSAPENLVDK